MALFTQQVLLVAADLMFASALSCLLYAAGCLVVAGGMGYVIVRFWGVMKKAKRNIVRKKRAVMSRVSESSAGEMVANILGLAGSLVKAPCLSKWASVLKEGCVTQLPVGEKRCQSSKILTGSHLSQTGMSCGMKRQPGIVWEEERVTSQEDKPEWPAKQKNASTISALLHSFLFVPPSWFLKKISPHWFTSLLTSLKTSRD
ncbi:uncharacterized protein LOC129335179 [Eublepharis macularius]|uniref:Uncharacterized protein LOC129335179 n=1 Tax=Eublepharis macularius TaxID=481883 RepID=A0AA97JQY6_EUBMA|nr:uncharacterized protein LOC129335179 [Eublepharis macularius]